MAEICMRHLWVELEVHFTTLKYCKIHFVGFKKEWQGIIPLNNSLAGILILMHVYKAALQTRTKPLFLMK